MRKDASSAKTANISLKSNAHHRNGSPFLNAANWSQAQWKMQREKGD